MLYLDRKNKTNNAVKIYSKYIIKGTRTFV